MKINKSAAKQATISTAILLLLIFLIGLCAVIAEHSIVLGGIATFVVITLLAWSAFYFIIGDSKIF